MTSTLTKRRIAYAGAVVSVRPSDGVTVVGTVLFNTSSVPAQLNQNVSAMVNSMLRDQAPPLSLSQRFESIGAGP